MNKLKHPDKQLRLQQKIVNLFSFLTPLSVVVIDDTDYGSENCGNQEFKHVSYFSSSFVFQHIWLVDVAKICGVNHCKCEDDQLSWASILFSYYLSILVIYL